MTIILRLPPPAFAIPGASVVLAAVVLLCALQVPPLPAVQYGPPLPPIPTGAYYGLIAKNTFSADASTVVIVETQDQRITTFRGPLIESWGEVAR